MKNEQREVLDNMSEDELRIAISVHFQNKDIVNYCEEKLECLNVDAAMVEKAETKGFGE